LDRVAAETADAEHRQHAVWPERAGVAQLLNAAIRRQPRIGERRELFGLQIEALVDLDEIFGGNRKVLGIAAIRPEARPPAMRANLRVALLAVTARLIAPASDHDDLIALLEAGRCKHRRPDLFDLAGISCPGVIGKVASL
jgi:hypothetical protein